MPFKETIAWISALSTAVVWGGFFGFMALTGGERPGWEYLTGFIAAVVVQAVIVSAAAIVAAIRAPADAQASADERDRAVARRSSAIAYPVLLVLVLAVAGSMHLGVGPRGMAYGIMAAIVGAELVHYGAQIVGYRRGWHG